MHTDTPCSPRPNDTRLAALAADANARKLPLCEKIQLVASVLAAADPEGFDRLDGLTRPEGQAILLSKCPRRLRSFNPTAAVKPLFRSAYYVDTGHDSLAAERLIEAMMYVEAMMRSLGYSAGTVSQVKTMLRSKVSFEDLLKKHL